MPTLLETAKATKPARSPRVGATDEEIELALAWMRQEVFESQVAIALGKPAHWNVANKMARILRAAYARGYLAIVEVGA